MATGIKSMRDDTRLSYLLSGPFGRREETWNIRTNEVDRFGFPRIEASHTRSMGLLLSDKLNEKNRARNGARVVITAWYGIQAKKIEGCLELRVNQRY